MSIANIRTFQLKLNLTNREAAIHLGCCSERTWANWICGVNKPPLSFLKKLDSLCEQYDQCIEDTKKYIYSLPTDSNGKIVIGIYSNFESYEKNKHGKYIDFRIAQAVLASLFNSKIMELRYLE